MPINARFEMPDPSTRRSWSKTLGRTPRSSSRESCDHSRRAIADCDSSRGGNKCRTGGSCDAGQSVQAQSQEVWPNSLGLTLLPTFRVAAKWKRLDTQLKRCDAHTRIGTIDSRRHLAKLFTASFETVATISESRCLWKSELRLQLDR
jgi:hypothetical protein